MPSLLGGKASFKCYFKEALFFSMPRLQPQRQSPKMPKTSVGWVPAKKTPCAAQLLWRLAKNASQAFLHFVPLPMNLFTATFMAEHMRCRARFWVLAESLFLIYPNYAFAFDIDSVIHEFPPITEPLPITVSPPKIVAFA